MSARPDPRRAQGSLEAYRARPPFALGCASSCLRFAPAFSLLGCSL